VEKRGNRGGGAAGGGIWDGRHMGVTSGLEEERGLPQVWGRGGSSRKLENCLWDTVAACFGPNIPYFKGIYRTI
jgi:hypothetical protein